MRESSGKTHPDPRRPTSLRRDHGRERRNSKPAQTFWEFFQVDSLAALCPTYAERHAEAWTPNLQITMRLCHGKCVGQMADFADFAAGHQDFYDIKSSFDFWVVDQLQVVEAALG